MYTQVNRKSKYNNVSSCYNGYYYQSKFEASYAQELDLRIKCKDIKKWERQVVIPIYLHGKLITNYKMDFKVYHNDGSIEYVETKGLADYAFMLRWKMVEAVINATEPGSRLTIVKQQSGWTKNNFKHKKI